MINPKALWILITKLNILLSTQLLYTKSRISNVLIFTQLDMSNWDEPLQNHAKTSSNFTHYAHPYKFTEALVHWPPLASLFTDQYSIAIPLSILPSRTSAFCILSCQCIKPNTGTYTPARDIRILQSGNIRKNLVRSRVIGAGWASQETGGSQLGKVEWCKLAIYWCGWKGESILGRACRDAGGVGLREAELTSGGDVDALTARNRDVLCRKNQQFGRIDCW